MTFNDFVTILYQVTKPTNSDGRDMGKAPFIRHLLSLNCEKTADLGFLDSPDSTVSTYLKRGLSWKIATELLRLMEQTEFTRWIDELGDEQQKLLYDQLSKHHSNVDYEKLSESCADIFKTIIQESVCKERNSQKSCDDNSDHKQSDEFLAELSKLLNKPKNVWIIHYACTKFNEPIYPARVTCIAMRPLFDTSTKTFSIIDEAQKMQLDPSEISTRFDTLECNMLSDFFEFVQNLHHPVWLHWNMRDAKYGFEAIINRYRYLSSKSIANIFNRKIDAADYLKMIYGYDYADHPRLQSICKINNISLLDFITGEEEATAFQNGEYNKILNSTLRKINCIHSLVQMCVTGVLKTKHDVWSPEQLPSCESCPFCPGISNSAPIKRISS